MSILNRVLSVLLALAFLVLAVLVLVDVVASWVGHGGTRVPIPYQRPSRWLHAHTWTSTPVVAGLIVLAVLGLVLLVAELRPRRPGLLALHTAVDGVSIGAPRRSLSRALSRVAAGVDGISSSTADLGARTATVRATTHLRDTTGLSDQVTERVTGWLEGLQLERTPRVKVSLRQEER